MIRVDRFTESAQDVASRSAEIMQRYGHNQMDVEHVLLALIEQPQGVSPRLLEFQKVDANALSARLDDLLRARPAANDVSAGPGQIFITPGVVSMLTRANEEASRLNELISPEHMFLAIFSEPDTQAARLLEEAGLTRDNVSAAFRQMRG